jgi:hypothetical protein
MGALGVGIDMEAVIRFKILPLGKLQPSARHVGVWSRGK